MSMRRFAALTIAFVAAITLAGGSGTRGAAGQPGSGTDSAPGLRVTPISVPEGTIRVYLPDDIAAGDTISGTVVAEPAGNTDAERSANSSTLDGYVIDVAAKKVSVAQHALTFIIPVASATAGLVIRRSNGREVQRISVPVRAQQPAFGRVPLPNDFRFPQIVASGQPFPINGPFGGDFAKSSLVIGGQPATKIAESPRTLIAAPASNVTGRTSYQLNENGVAVTAPCNVVSLKLTAPKTQLRKGEHTAVHVQISGLDGIREPAPLRIVNLTPGVVTLAGGPTQELNVGPGDVRPDGTYATDREITALVAGSFSIHSTIDVQRVPFNNGTSVATVLSPPPVTQATATPHAKKNPITSDWPQLSADDQKSVQAQLDKGAGSRADALAELVKIMKKYCCNFDTMADGTPVYDPNTEGEGATEREKGGKVSLGPAAFSSVAWLYSSLKHEMVHSQQWQDPDAADKLGSKGREKQAYQREIDNAANTGLSDAEKAEDKRRLEKYK
jgi:hypothetical protein